MTDQIQLEPEAHAFAEAAARSPLLFTLGPEQGRLALDQVQSGTIRKPAVDMEDLTITDGPSAQVALRVVPAVMLLSLFFAHPRALTFRWEEMVAMAGAVGLTLAMVSDARSKRWEGMLLVAAYAAIAVGFAFAGNR